MVNREAIIKEIKAELAVEFEVEESVMTPDAVIYDTLKLDSLSLVDLIGIVQTRYGILIKKEELPGIKTFNDLYDYIEQHS